MNQARRQAYLTLIESLLTCPSEERTAILQANIELLDDEFAQYLREWATETLPKLDADKAETRAKILYNLNNNFSSLQQGSRRSNIEIAIACLDIGLTIFTHEAYPEKWAMFQNSIGVAYSNKIKGDRGDNLERAIACYEAALQVRTRTAFPEDWAMTQNNLAVAYRNRIKGDRGDNLERAIGFYEAALQVYTRTAFPEKWATTQNNLANAYCDRIKEDKGDNLEMAIKFYKAALQVYTRTAFPEDWAMTQNNLATAYSDRIKGDRGDNLERAIGFYKAALQVYTRTAFPQDWAMTQNNLATAYSQRIKGDRGDNLERAIGFYKAALQVYTRTAFPQDWANTQNNLATAYSQRIKGDRGDNLERAIALLEAALQVYTRTAFPEDWAMTQNNLGEAYSDRIKGDRGDNLERAIKSHKAALEFRTPTTLPLGCLETGRNLGNLGFDESLWETAIFGYEKAIEAVEQSREWVTSLTRKQELIEENLNIYEKMMQSCINHQQYHKAVQTVERSKSRYLVELFTNSEIYPKTATEPQKQQLRDLRRQIAAAQQSLETPTPTPPLSPPLTKGGPGGFPKTQLPLFLPPLTKGGPGGVPEDSDTQRTTQTRTLTPESQQQQTDNLATALQQLAEFLEPFKQRESEFQLTQKVAPLNITEFQQTLDKKTAIIEWYIGKPDNFNSQDWGGSCFIITHNKIQSIPITCAQTTELETWKDEYLNEYRGDKQTNLIWQNSLPQKLQQLSQILRLNQIVAQIPKDCDQLILVPHRYLHLFPLHALPFTLENKGGHGGTAPTKNLLDCFPNGVKYAPSLQLLQLVQNRLKTRASILPESQPLFAIQNPTEDLANADMEVETIKQRFNPHDILIKSQATKIAFTENVKNLSNASYIHFSCHGVFNFDNPLLSLLALAGSVESASEINPPQPPLAKGGLQENEIESASEINPPQPPLAKGGLQENEIATDSEINPTQSPVAKGGLQEDMPETARYVRMRSGKTVIPEKCLTLEEIFAKLELSQCNLVTLSACETGLTDSTTMTDEYIGLPSGFLYAGSMNVVSTLWKVDDFATAIFMIKFYQELLPQVSVALALNATQNWMRAITREEFTSWIELLNLDKKSRQSAQLWVMASTEKQPFSKPWYWAAFFATGY
ncbi:CHAT domain-containing protein [Microcoleus sp. bin38.metabat.b11b12b14.051]|uniref:CHAT domain-containing protein n=1 Tax=Microcoleus sp. bin38.metabat.b11b12b14.051 TaxID=2742709 RepID=UPI0025CE2F26|nr:CHAT domain-containing protein [Microcoleus sp. bin38.metabat.b11b12b14.051]